MERLLFDKIITNYGINDTSIDTIEVMEGYPHIYELKLLKEEFLVKKVKNIYCKNIDKLYGYLKNSNYILLPQINLNGSYSIIFNNSKYLVYKKVSEINDSPSAIWWSNSLSSIHNTEVCMDDFTNFNLYNETLSILNSASKYFDDKIKTKIKVLLNMVSNENKKEKKLVLSHSDPCDKNVMLDDNLYKIIDTDTMRLLPKEFDIQRLLHNILINSSSIDYLMKYWQDFLISYEKNSCDNIDVNLLKKIYIYDLIRTFSWLTLVSNDPSRADYQRQRVELNLYQTSIVEDKHIKFLKKI